MATPTTTPIDIQAMVLRLQPEAQFQWTGDVLGLYAQIGEWRTPQIPQPTEAEVYAEWDIFQAEQAAEAVNAASDEYKVTTARSNVKAIPGWATWDEATALTWHDQRLSDAVIDAVNSLTKTKIILKHIATENRAIVRMLLALRDHTWPGLDRD